MSSKRLKVKLRSIAIISFPFNQINHSSDKRHSVFSRRLLVAEEIGDHRRGGA